MSTKIRKGDTVEVITGRTEDKGKRGEVIKVFPEENRLVIQGVNLRSKHQKQVQSQGRTVSPGMVRFESSIDISNVMLVCPKCGKTSRLGVHADGEIKSRVCKKCNALIDE
ncbi:MAG: 50S ribosomal protein L24 [Chloroflexi bacterium 44-23]|nr:MAG: 50S ribosomal protein L24 [Chloroflexi bacterium 44-23]